MKFSASSSELLKALSLVNGAVPSKSPLPILDCILFERQGDTLQLSATDLEISIVQRLPVAFEGEESATPDRIAVPARRLLDTMRALPDLPISFESGGDFQIKVKTDQGLYKMSGQDGGDYPSIPEIKGATEVETMGVTLKRAVDKTAFAVSKDALRPAMMGIFFQINKEGSHLVATDGHRLVRLSLNSVTSEEDIDFIVPGKALNLASRVASEGKCTIMIGESYAGFNFGDTLVLARLISESYPNYQAVIPLENDRRLTVNRESLLAAVRRVSLYSSSITHQIRLYLKDNEVEITAEDIERASEAKESVVGEFDSEPLEIGFNSSYLTEVLSHVDAEEVIMEFSNPNRAGVVTPGMQADGEEMLMLIMPVMLNTAYA